MNRERQQKSFSQKPQRQRDNIPNNVVNVGSKEPAAVYFQAIMLKFADHGMDKIIVQARGKGIINAVNAALMYKDRFAKGSVQIASTDIFTDHVEYDGITKAVSAIKIVMEKVNTLDDQVKKILT